MKKHLSMGILALLTMSAAASAAEQPGQRGRLFRFDFDCEFHRHDDGAVSSSAMPGHDDQKEFKECEARAKVFAWVDRDDKGRDGRVTMLWDKDRENRLRVECDQREIYDDGAILESLERFVEIEGLRGTPAIFVFRHDQDDAFSTQWMRHRALLKIFDDRLRGSCNVRAEPADDDGARSGGALD